jgi:Family of unknown function (DUF5343)
VAEKHPYTSGSGGLIQTVAQLRKSFPAIVSSETLKKLEIAPNNETYVLNILKFVGVLDAENKKTTDSTQIFNKHDDAEFQQGFAKLVEKSYHELFALHGDGAWALTVNKLISFFRNHDSDIVGKRQATTFQTLASLSGKTTATPAQAASKSIGNGSKVTKPVKLVRAVTTKTDTSSTPPSSQSKAEIDKSTASPMALTVRVEINLPAGGDQKTYDAIFKSIRENLLNGHGA